MELVRESWMRLLAFIGELGNRLHRGPLVMAKKKKYNFSVILYLEGLSTVPFVNGCLHAKVRLLNGGKFTKCTPSSEVLANSVVWDSNFEFTCNMSANASTGVLNSCKVRISVRKEVKGGRSALKLGFVDLDLAEYAGAGLTSFKRYLLEPYSNSRQRPDNSALKMSVEISLVTGDPLFMRPSYPLSSRSRSQFYLTNVPTPVHTPRGSIDSENNEDRVDNTRINADEVVQEVLKPYIPKQPPSLPSHLSPLCTNELDDDRDATLGELFFRVHEDGTATLASRFERSERK